jgi:hypothetical protein
MGRTIKSLLRNLFYFLIFVFSFGCSPGINREQAMQIVAAPESSSNKFEIAIKQLNSYPVDSSFWLKIGSDERFDADRRRHCIRYFFDDYNFTNTDLKTFLKATGPHPNWISYDRIIKMSQIFAGLMPSEVLKGHSRFVIPILSDHGGDYRLEIFISFQKDLSLKDLTQALEGTSKSNEDEIIAGCAAWDSVDEEKRHNYNLPF